jgi:hypothetical protein
VEDKQRATTATIAHRRLTLMMLKLLQRAASKNLRMTSLATEA